MNLVHIGLGKTATTTLQRFIFPEISRLRPSVVFNNTEITDLLKKDSKIGLSEAELDILQLDLSKRSNLISLEYLVNWNPRNWEVSADKNLKLFGAQTHIVITVRDMVSYLTSTYQQKVHEGNIQCATDFFVSSQEYDAMPEKSLRSSQKIYDVDSFDLEHLVTLYKQRFEKVSVVPLEMLSEIRFIKDHYDLDYDETIQLQVKFKQSKRLNVAYSALAMDFTFKREALRRRSGMKNVGRVSLMLKSLYRDRTRKFVNDPRYRVYTERYSNLSISQMLLQFPFRLARRTLRPVSSWRGLMQLIVNRYLPYQEYQLPTQCYRNKVLEEKNAAFIDQLIRENKAKEG
jgi:hypothetical protein